jgi:hypothetical protein
LTFLDSPKEILEGGGDTLQRVLYDLRMDASQVQSKLFDLRQLIGLIEVADRLMADSIGIPSFLNGGVVEFAQNCQPGLKDSTDLCRRLEFELECPHGWNYT